MAYVIVAKEVREDATYYERPEQTAARKRLADMNGLTFDTLDEVDEFLDMRGVAREEGWAYPSEHAAPGSTSIWFLRLRNPAFRIGGGFQLCRAPKPKAKYAGTHPGNIAAGLREIAQTLKGTKEGAALEDYAGDVERLGRAAGIKFLG